VLIVKALENGSAEAKGIKVDGSRKGNGNPNVANLPFEDLYVQSLRTRGLRENIKR
jgi:hypothetical protein